MSIEARVGLDRGDLSLDAELTVGDGETVALLGPNGAGKSTLLAAIAGLLPIDRGRITIGGTVVDDPAGPTLVPAPDRDLGVVFQQHLLFPHLSARDNVAFGLRCRGIARRAAAAEANEWLDRFGLTARAEARPADLSGGEAQRVALARALAFGPVALLLDEPLSALDVETRDEIRRELRAHLAGFAGPRVLVTHDPVEAAVLADRVVVLEGGRVTHVGTMADLTREPRSPYVARLVGLNLYRGTGAGTQLTIAAGGSLAGSAEQPLAGPAVATVRPQAVALHLARPEGTPRNVWEGRVASVDQVGDRVRVAVEATPPIVAEITPGALADLHLTPGDEVWISVKATDVTLAPA